VRKKCSIDIRKIDKQWLGKLSFWHGKSWEMVGNLVDNKQWEPCKKKKGKQLKLKPPGPQPS
jgi:hypothetical protein